MLYFPLVSLRVWIELKKKKKDFISQPSVLPLIYFSPLLFCLVFLGRGFLHMANDAGPSALFNSRVLNSDWKLCVTVWGCPTLKFIEGSDQVIHLVRIFPFSLLRFRGGADSSNLLGRCHTGCQYSGARGMQLHECYVHLILYLQCSSLCPS